MASAPRYFRAYQAIETSHRRGGSAPFGEALSPSRLDDILGVVVLWVLAATGVLIGLGVLAP